MAPHLSDDIRCSGARSVTIEPVREGGLVTFYVYRGDTLVRACPSVGMAEEVAAGVRAELAVSQ